MTYFKTSFENKIKSFHFEKNPEVEYLAGLHAPI